MGFRSLLFWDLEDFFGNILSRIFWPRCSAGTVVVEDGKLLAVDTGNYLMLPTGALEYRETFREAAKRETREETGVEVEIGEKVHEQLNSVGGVEVLFDAEASDRKLEGGWEGKPVWIPVDEVGDRKWRYNRDIERLLESSGLK